MLATMLVGCAKASDIENTPVATGISTEEVSVNEETDITTTEKETETVKETKPEKQTKPVKETTTEEDTETETEEETTTEAEIEVATTTQVAPEPVPDANIQSVTQHMGTVNPAQLLAGINYDAILPVPASAPVVQAGAAHMYQYGGIYKKNADKKVVYLTFTLAYETGYSSAIMDVLARKNVKAAFFLVSSEYVVPKNFPIMQKMVAQGHLVGSHGHRHVYTNTLSDVALINDIVTSAGTISAALGGYPVTYYKPPYGYISVRDCYVAQKLGMVISGNSFQYYDYGPAQAQPKQQALNNMVSGLCPGAVYYLHVTKCNYEAIGDFIDYARALGYQFLRLDQNSASDSLVVETTTAKETEPATKPAKPDAETTAKETTAKETTKETKEETTEESSNEEPVTEESTPETATQEETTTIEETTTPEQTTTIEETTAALETEATVEASSAEVATEEVSE